MRKEKRKQEKEKEAEKEKEGSFLVGQDQCKTYLTEY